MNERTTAVDRSAQSRGGARAPWLKRDRKAVDECTVIRATGRTLYLE
jgi:hypothetical protein